MSPGRRRLPAVHPRGANTEDDGHRHIYQVIRRDGRPVLLCVYCPKVMP